jgi:quercetin dioxygenase-like cupin family protein
MPYINFNERKKVKIWEGINAALFHSEQVTFEHVILEKGAEVKLHQHIHEPWTHVIEGAILFDLDGEQKILTPGMTAFMPSNATHGAEAITEFKVIDCFIPVREDFFKISIIRVFHGINFRKYLYYIYCKIRWRNSWYRVYSTERTAW